jgi:ATP-dependent protease ClpP protease subunit
MIKMMAASLPPAREMRTMDNELTLYGSVGYSWWEEEYFTAKTVRTWLKGRTGDIVVRINSGGGIASEGQAIYTALIDYAGKVTVKVDGVAASAASLIAMAGDEIEMRLGAWMLIHDPATPWTLGRGTEEDHRKEADLLAVISNAYADIYAATSGMTREEARQVMKDETVLDGQMAVDMGFATRVEGAEVAIPAARFDYRMYANAPADLREASKDLGPVPGKAAVMAMIAGRARIQQKEPSMALKAQTPAEASPADDTTPKPDATGGQTPAVVTEPTPVETPVASMQAERARARRITESVAAAGLPITMATDLIGGGKSLETCLDEISAKWKEKGDVDTPMMGRETAKITRDEVDTRVEGMISALMGKNDGAAAEYRGLRLKSLAMHLAGPRKGFNDVESVRAGMTSITMMGGAIGVSDFSFITTSVMNRTLLAEYQRRAATWMAVSGAPLSAPDFRELLRVRFGGDFQMKKVLENGEYQNTTLVDEAEGVKLERRGRTIQLTFESIINDDMGALSRIPVEFAIAARLMENGMVWSLIRNNAVLKSDGLALFIAAHKNLAAVGSAISATSVGAARKAMWEQRALGVKDTDDFLNIEPDRLIVPPALELAALQFAQQTTPATDGTTNPFKATLSPIVVPNIGAAAAGGSDTAWYLVSSNYPPVATAYLDGYPAPTISTVEGMNPDIVTMNARHIFAAANTEFRGSYKNPGL